MNKKMKRNTNNNLYRIGVIVLLLITGIVQLYREMNDKDSAVADHLVQATLVGCIDGDTATLNVEGTQHKVRFISIDTPEVDRNDYYAKEAKEYTCNRLKSGTISLEFDENSDRFDDYNRMIAWVYVDGALLQEEIVEQGYGRVKYVYGDYKYVDALYELQDLAKKSKVGIWR